MNTNITLFSAVFSLLLVLSIHFEFANSKIVIDNDAGGDDAMAIFLTLLYEKHFDGPKLIALTTGNGNTEEDNVCINNQRILKVADRQDPLTRRVISSSSDQDAVTCLKKTILRPAGFLTMFFYLVPIYRGAKSSLVRTPETVNYYGKDGLGDNDDNPTDLAPAQEQNAVLTLIELSKKYEGELTVITIGTLTNVALAIKLDPEFLGRLEQLYIAAGHIRSDEHPDAEFNARMDVEAYHIVAQNANPDKVTIFPYSQTKKHLDFSRDWRENVLGAIDTDIMKAQNNFERVSLAMSDRWQSLDPAMVAMVINPNLIEEYRYAKNDIILCDENRGINTNTFVEKDEANVRVIYLPKHEEYKQFLIDVFSADVDK